MLSPFSLPVMGGSLLAAVVVGLQLGQSSVGLINPIYYQAPPLHPRLRGAAIDENTLSRSTEPAYGQLYGSEQGNAARAADCGNCEALRARDAYAYAYSARVPYFGGGERPSHRVQEARADLGDRFAQVPEEAESRFAAVDRYAHYAVSEDDVAPAVVALPAAVAVAAADAPDEPAFAKEPADSH